MKLNIIGLEVSEGISAKTNKPYAIGKLHCVVPISQTTKGTNLARGGMGATFQCAPELLRPFEAYPLPFVGEAEFQAVMRYGDLVQEIVGLVPGERTASKAAAAPAGAVATR